MSAGVRIAVENDEGMSIPVDPNSQAAINADKKVPVDNVVAVMRVARELGARTVLSVEKD